MAFENQAAVGKSFLISLALTNSTNPPIDSAFTEVAATRDLTYGPEWDNADTTARGTGNTSTSLVTFKNNNIEITGLFLINNDFQRDVEDHIENPPSAMNGQPYAWLRIFEPRAGGAGETKDYPVTLSSFRKSASYNAEVTYDMSCQAQGDPVVTAVAAP